MLGVAFHADLLGGLRHRHQAFAESSANPVNTTRQDVPDGMHSFGCAMRRTNRSMPRTKRDCRTPDMADAEAKAYRLTPAVIVESTLRASQSPTTASEAERTARRVQPNKSNLGVRVACPGGRVCSRSRRRCVCCATTAAGARATKAGSASLACTLVISPCRRAIYLARRSR